MTASNSFSVAVLDDYQRVARGLADWASLSPQAETVFFHDHAGEGDQLIARLRPFDILVLMRERTRNRRRHYRAPAKVKADSDRRRLERGH